jgi:hypothetical protein
MIKSVSFQAIKPIIIEKLNNNGTVSITVKGSSMWPFYKDSITIVSLKKPTLPYKKYDVILYHTFHGTVLHRITKVRNDMLKTTGDALTKVEDVAYEDVIAVVYSYNNGKKEILSRNPWVLLKVKCWVFLKPLRRIILGILRRVHVNGK